MKSTAFTWPVNVAQKGDQLGLPVVHDSAEIAPISTILRDASAGKLFILVDSPNRENEGDLIVLADHATPDAINFMAKYGRGLICLALSRERAQQLALEPMARRNVDPYHTAFAMSIDARKGISTGISAADRATTILKAVEPDASPDDFFSPGHVFPLIAAKGGVLERQGHTEASVEIAHILGVSAAAVICEIMNDDGSMARLPDLVRFAHEHNLNIGTISDLVAYCQKRTHHQSGLEMHLQVESALHLVEQG